jgi:cytochrome b561
LETVPFTGLVIHEWLGIALVAMVFAHLLLSWSWIASQSRRWFARQTLRSRINYLLNLSLFAAMTALIFSGIVISQKAIPALIGAKIAPDMDWRWDSIHNQFSNWVVILSGLHLALNWDWALAAGRRIFRRFLGDAL